MSKHTLFVVLLKFTFAVAAQNLCPKGWNSFETSCYLFVVHSVEVRPMTWKDARDNCRRYGGDLVKITSSAEADFIHNSTRDFSFQRFWIGLFRNDTSPKDPKSGFVWSDGTKYTYSADQWRENQPDNNLNENCVEKYSAKKLWNDLSCARKSSSICEIELKNVAFKKKTTQISVAPNGYSRLAVDGNRNTNFSSGSCALTEFCYSPWWRVDLGSQYTVRHLIITNRGDCCHENLTNFEIRIGNSLADEGNGNQNCGARYSVGKGESKTIVCSTPIKGRYVNIWIPNKETTLTLCEVEIYAVPDVAKDVKNLTQDISSCGVGWEPFRRSCYKFVSSRHSWSEANALCRVDGSYLAKVDDSVEQDFLTARVRPYGKNFWIGLTDFEQNRIWTWESSSKILASFTNWQKGEPNYFDEEKCVFMYHHFDAGYWNNDRCIRREGYVCEKEDIDECAIGRHDCHKHARCVNNIGSFSCYCKTGFAGNGTHCQDIDECFTGRKPCQKTTNCINTIGSFFCQCNDGYIGNTTMCQEHSSDSKSTIIFIVAALAGFSFALVLVILGMTFRKKLQFSREKSQKENTSVAATEESVVQATDSVTNPEYTQLNFSQKDPENKYEGLQKAFGSLEEGYEKPIFQNKQAPKFYTSTPEANSDYGTGGYVISSSYNYQNC